jgi:hypothetical protein
MRSPVIGIEQKSTMAVAPDGNNGKSGNINTAVSTSVTSGLEN